MKKRHQRTTKRKHKITIKRRQKNRLKLLKINLSLKRVCSPLLTKKKKRERKKNLKSKKESNKKLIKSKGYRKAHLLTINPLPKN